MNLLVLQEIHLGSQSSIGRWQNSPLEQVNPPPHNYILLLSQMLQTSSLFNCNDANLKPISNRSIILLRTVFVILQLYKLI